MPVRAAALILFAAVLSPAAAADDAAPATGRIQLSNPAQDAVRADAVLDALAIPSPLGDMWLGGSEAPVTVVEYASMTCSHCASFAKDGFPKLKADYIDTGKVRYVFREFPLDVKAAAGSVLIRCIAKGNAAKFFEMTDHLFRTQDDWIGNRTGDVFKAVARKEGLEQKEFEACFGDKDALAGIQRTQDVAAQKLNVSSTPTFFVNGVMVKGNAYSEIEKAIKSAK